MKTHVIMCCHNGEKFVEEQLLSIMAQSMPIDHIHIFDFASTDATCDTIRQFVAAKRTSVISLVEQLDAPGASLSFFRAFDLVISKVEDRDCVFLCDQDDVWLPKKSKTVVAAIERLFDTSTSDHVAVFHDVEVVDERLTRLRRTYYTGDPFRIPRDLAPDRLLLANPVIGHTLAISGTLLKTVSHNVRGARYLMHDWATVLVVSRVGRIAFVPEVLSLYRQHSANVLGAYGRRTGFEIFGRTIAFALRVVDQSLAFSADLRRLRGGANHRGELPLSRIDRALAVVAPNVSWLAFPLLATYAVVRGPTLKRRLLGPAMLLAALWRALGIPSPNMQKRNRQ